MEEWKDIYYYDFYKKKQVDFRNRYQVSNFGRVRSLNYNKTGQIKLLNIDFKTTGGYGSVTLSKYGESLHYRVHRLVAGVFIENPHGYPIVNHKDCNPANNHVSNLEWCDYKYNSIYGEAKGKMVSTKIQNGSAGGDCPWSKLTGASKETLKKWKDENREHVREYHRMYCREWRKRKRET